ncbi:accessory gene regulator B [Pseudobutyrivibrio sp. UC1225]|uniref:accessory gene regulator B family protein n=1 Tax=Pseudobutyrivibrio sp. UC1225 TaxID=1798185 RepID=UPI0008F1568E|nr:accessory gene regulator B family protein [Pseudobutyrivibrio sp. UC1225]SFO03778.1 accessory gene regulator B [Pseudobutyrivibrio sp. UC1225]
MKRVIQRLTNNLIVRAYIEEQDRELYEYAIFSILLHIIPVIIIWIIGILLGKTFEYLLFIISFLIIRKYSGGYHADSLSHCIVQSSVVIITTLLLVSNININNIFKIFTIGAAIMVFILSPLENENKPLSITDRHFYRRVIGILLLINVCLGYFFYVIGNVALYAHMSVVIILVFLLQIVEIIKGNVKKHK